MNIFYFLFPIELLLCYITHHRRKNLLETFYKIFNTRQIDTCIPEELTTIHKHLCKFALRLFRERLYGICIREILSIPYLYIAIAWLRSRGAHTKRQHTVMILHELQTIHHTLIKHLLLHYCLI